MNKLFFVKLCAAVSIAAGLVACSGGSSSGDELPDPSSPDKEAVADSAAYATWARTDMKIDEVSSVWIYELDSKFKETGRKFKADKRKDGLTKFVVDTVVLASRYALLRTEGFRIRSYEQFPVENYVEVPLEILVDMEDTLPVGISLAGQFVTQRAIKLASDGMPMDSALQQAHGELLKVFYWDVDALKRESLIHNGLLSAGWYAGDVMDELFERFMITGELSERVSAFVAKFAADGKFEDYAVFEPILDYYADELRVSRFSKSDNRPYYGKKNVLIQLFMAGLYGFGECNADKYCEIKKLNYEGEAAYNDSVFICDTLGWMLSTFAYRNTCRLGPAEDRDTHKGLVDTTALFYYHGTFGRWEECNSVQKVIGMCKPSRAGEYASVGDTAFFQCTNYLWLSITAAEYYANQIACDSAERYIVLASDSVTPFYCDYGKLRTLTDAERALYDDTKGLKCDTTAELHLANDSLTYYVCDAGNLRKASALEISAKRGCTGYNMEEIRKIDYSNYRCRGSWKYMKDSIYRDTVTDARDGQKYPLVGMAKQLWFAAYLNYETDSSWCYNDSAANCDKYGRLYRLAEANSHNADSLLCPKGFHVPSKDEFQGLFDFASEWGSQSDGISPLLKSKEAGGKDWFGFNALLGGVREDGNFVYAGSGVYMCTQGAATAKSLSRYRLAQDLSFTYDTVTLNHTCYIRCLAD